MPHPSSPRSPGQPNINRGINPSVDVVFHSDALTEWRSVPAKERAALQAALEKLRAYGVHLSFPHASSVRGGRGLWELRPRAGRSPWRAIYRRVGDALVIAAVCPEATVDPRGFDRGVELAGLRLDSLTEEQHGELDQGGGRSR